MVLLICYYFFLSLILLCIDDIYFLIKVFEYKRFLMDYNREVRRVIYDIMISFVIVVGFVIVFFLFG